jgi:DNA-binding NarL/FixJ family response regulator
MASVNNFRDFKPTIMIVEDHDALRDSLKSWLGSVFYGCNIVIAKSGEEALDKSFTQKPDIVLMDVMLPGINGIEAARRIKDTVPGIHVVILSIYEDSAYQADAAAAGVYAYIPKREMGSTLISMIAGLLSDAVKMPSDLAVERGNEK